MRWRALLNLGTSFFFCSGRPKTEVLRGAKRNLEFTDKILMECHSEILKSQVESFLKTRKFRKVLEIEGRPLLYTVYFSKDAVNGQSKV